MWSCSEAKQYGEGGPVEPVSRRSKQTASGAWQLVEAVALVG